MASVTLGPEGIAGADLRADLGWTPAHTGGPIGAATGAPPAARPGALPEWAAAWAPEAARAVGGPVAWLAGQYPRATDTFIMREVAGLRALGVDVQTFSMRRTGPEHLVGPEQRAEAAGTTHVFEAAKRPGVALRAHLAALRRPLCYLQSMGAAWRTAAPGIKGRVINLAYWHEAVVLAHALRERGFVHLHCHIAKAACTVARLAAPLAGVTWSFTLHGPDDLEEPGRWCLRDKLARADFVSCISSFCRSQAMLHSDPRDWPKLHVVHCGVEPGRHAAAAAVEPPAAGRLLFVGRLAAAKGVPVLLDALRLALARDPSLTLTLVGDGPERAHLEGLARGLPATFLGYRNQAEVAELLASHAALVLPSFAEGVPVVLMEALASGRPAVTTRIAGIAELVEDGVSGRLVPPGEERALAEAILALAGSGAAARGRMGEAGRALVAAEFDSAREAGRLLRLLRHARAGGPRPSRRPGDGPGEVAAS